MRPLRLEFEGFGTFRDRTVVDFADLDLVSFVGPTGSGKSTVIDAMTFALYGSVARYDNPSLVAPVIHQLSAEAKVRFDFEVGGTTYTAVRVVRRGKSKPGAAPRANTREARLEQRPGGWVADANTDDAAELSTVLAGNVSELDREVGRLIGLDFAQFTRTIVLPQGDFAEFLKDDPGSRQKLLRRLLDIDIYASMGAQARERAARAQQQHEVYERELGRLAEVTPERLAAAETTVLELTAFAETAAGLLSRLASTDAELAERRERVNRLDAELTKLAAVVLPSGLSETDLATTTAKQRLAAAEEDLAEGRHRRDTVADELAAVGDPVAIGSQLSQLWRRAELLAAMEKVDGELERLNQSLTSDEPILRERRQRLDEAVTTARQARTGADAASWVARLAPGELCPICDQTVTDPPRHVGHDEVAAAEERAEARQRELDEATSAVATARGRLQGLEADARQHRRLIAEVDESLDGTDDVEHLTAKLDRAVMAGEAAKEASALVRAAEVAVGAAAGELKAAEDAEGHFRTEFNHQRDVVAEMKPPPPAAGSISEDWRSLEAWARALGAKRSAERTDVAAAGKELAAAKAELMDTLAAGAAPFELDPDPQTLNSAVAVARAKAAADVERLGDQLDHKAELAATVSELTETRVVHDVLGRQHLSANGFERWLLAEAMDDIVARATERLYELSNGRYSLEAVDGSFNVCDHGNADERRGVRTLSGGEVFLASLSLALALSDSIADLAPVDSPRLESIFLDEGFGTLDGETLDVLASAIEELAATGRFVAIVTHVRDLAERMPVRFEVLKGPVTSTIERSDA